MKSTTELLGLAKARNGDCTDYRLAKLLGVPHSTISHYKSGRSRPSVPISMRLAALCGLDPAQVICWVSLERSTDDDDREAWSLLLSRVQGANSSRLAA